MMMRSLLASSAFRLLQGLQATGPVEATAAAAALSSSQLFSRALSTSQPVSAPAAAPQGDVAGVLREIDRLMSSETAGAKEVSDAAVALAYLQAKDNRRLWGKVFEKVPTVQSGFDASSLSSFLWAATTAGVGHFKTIAELSGTAAALLPSLSPSQLSLVVEGLGKAGAKDEQLMAQIGAKVAGDIGSYKPADLARIVWGFAAAGVEDARLIMAAAKALSDKAGQLTAREASQAVWGLARLRYADSNILNSLAKAATKNVESAVDAAGVAWALGYIGHSADADVAKGLSSALKAGAADLSPAHAVDAAWGLGLLGNAPADVVSALFSNVSAALEKAPDALDPYQLASLYEAAAMTPGAKLPEQVAAYAGKMHALVEEGAKGKRSAGLAHFKDDLAQAVARSVGARYRPEIAAKVASFAHTTPDGVHVDIVADIGGEKVAIEGVGAHYLSSAGTPLGPALSRAKLLESKGFKTVLVPFNEFARATNPVDAAKLVLDKAERSVSSLSSKIRPLKAKLNESFDPYA